LKGQVLRMGIPLRLRRIKGANKKKGGEVAEESSGKKKKEKKKVNPS